MLEIKKASCFFCWMQCGMLVHIDDGMIVKVEGDQEHPTNQGGMCPRPLMWKEWLYHPDHLNFPLKRVGKRGGGEWKKITWEQALDEIAAKLAEIKEKYGAEAVASAGGTTRTDDWARSRFFNVFGSPNVFHTAIVCWDNVFTIETAIYGWGVDPDVMNSKCAIVWGHNPAVSFLPTMRVLLDARESRGTKIIVIDPRFTETASKADLWIKLRPGTDCALALGMINVIINEGIYDREFVEKWCYGFDKLKKRVQQYPPEKVSEITWVPKEKIIEAARTYATNKPATILWGVALDQIGRNGGAAIQARAILRGITGNLDVCGGNVLSGPQQSITTDAEMELSEMLPPKQRKKQLGVDRFKLMSWRGHELMSEYVKKVWGKGIPGEWCAEAHPPTVWRTILTGKPYPIKALIVLADNTIMSYANSKLVYKALKSENLDLMVVMDYWMTPTAMLADYVLPAASWLERPVMQTGLGCTNWFIASERPIKPLYERWTDYEFWRGLAIRLDMEEYWPWKSLEEAYGHRLEPLGYDSASYEDFVREVRWDFPYPEYKKYERTGFATSSGKVEIYSNTLEKLGYDPLPDYEEPAESPVSTPELYAEFPLILVAGGGFMPFHHTEQRHISSLRRMSPEPLVEIHPQTAYELGLSEGDWVYIENRRGKIKQKVKFNKGVDPKLVYAQRGWWFPEKPGPEPSLFGVWESNINVLTDDDPDHCDPLCGSWYTRGLLCKVYRA